ncbi:retrovirus-related Pol polyprotein from transposon opus [Trichonephila clavipes]|nr:retrovirus-related Pol polyprotein from transposon opus [Trichonephila clavipes]
MYGNLAGRRLRDNEKPHHNILQIMAVNGADKGLYVIGQINNISPRMVVDTGANVTSEDFGRTRQTKHRIDTGEHPPIKQHPQRLPFAKQEEIQKLIKDMKNNDVIEPLSSPWAFLILLVRKKDGSTRFCVNYRRLNDVTKKDSYPLPRIDDTLDTLARYTWFSTLNIKSGYWQDALTSAPILAYPEIGKQLILDTDATHESIGAVLSQEIDGQERIIAYFTKYLSKPERNYYVTRKELLVIIKAVEHFHPYLYGRRFLLRTDHASLTWLLNFKNLKVQIARWIQRLQEYDMEICHTKGSAHGNAEALSKRPYSESCKHCSRIEKKFDGKDPIVRQVTALLTSALDPWSDESIRKDQLADPEIKPIIEFKESSDEKPSWQDIASLYPTTKRYWALWDSLHLRIGVLYRK